MYIAYRVFPASRKLNAGISYRNLHLLIKGVNPNYLQERQIYLQQSIEIGSGYLLSATHVCKAAMINRTSLVVLFRNQRTVESFMLLLGVGSGCLGWGLADACKYIYTLIYRNLFNYKPMV
jgi:hypothetical protein